MIEDTTNQSLQQPGYVTPQGVEQTWHFVEDLKLKIKTQNHLYFEIGAMLKVIRDHNLYAQLDGGYSSFNEFLLDAEIGFKPRTAYNYIELYEYYIEKLKVNHNVIIGTPYWRLLEMKRSLKDKTPEEAIEIITHQSIMPTHEYTRMKKERGMDEKKPRMFQTTEGKWTIEVFKSNIHRITNLEDNLDLYHE